MILLVGKSGSGKDFFVTLFGLKPVVSRTTRKPRPGEINEIHKIFVSKEDFKTYGRENMLAYTVFDGEEYCALEIDFKGKNVYVIDPSGVRYLKNKKMIDDGYDTSYDDYPVVYIKSPLYRRAYRLFQRKGFRHTISRLVHDYFQFRDFERNKEYDVLLRN